MLAAPAPISPQPKPSRARSLSPAAPRKETTRPNGGGSRVVEGLDLALRAPRRSEDGIRAALAQPRSAPVAPPPDSQPTPQARSAALLADGWMQTHDENGHYAFIRADQTPWDSTHGLYSSILYMLTNARSVGRLHLNRSGILHIFIEGEPLHYFFETPEGTRSRAILGPNPVEGHLPYLYVPGNCWKASRLPQGAYGLIMEIVTPGWEQGDRIFPEQAPPEERHSERFAELLREYASWRTEMPRPHAG